MDVMHLLRPQVKTWGYGCHAFTSFTSYSSATSYTSYTSFTSFSFILQAIRRVYLGCPVGMCTHGKPGDGQCRQGCTQKTQILGCTAKA